MLLCEYNPRVEHIIQGREKSESGSWIPSLLDFDRVMVWMNDVAKYQQCPFAASFVYEIEKEVDQCKSKVDSELNAMIALNRDNMFTDAMEGRRRFKTDNLSVLSMILLNTIIRFGKLISEQHKGKCCGLVTLKECNMKRREIERIFRRIKHRPFEYTDRGISGSEFIGSMEWEKSLKELRRVPLTGKYRPRYFEADSDEGIGKTPKVLASI